MSERLPQNATDEQWAAYLTSLEKMVLPTVKAFQKRYGDAYHPSIDTMLLISLLHGALVDLDIRVDRLLDRGLP